MRCFYCAIIVCLFCGCQGNNSALRNPFMSPDRVPPPATRAILPGTAQPYYQGGPIPGGSVAPPPVYRPVPGAVPPGGWGSSPQSSVTSTPNVFPASAEIPLGPVASSDEPHIQINSDQQNLRFAAQPQLGDASLWSQPVPQATSPAVVPNSYPAQQAPAQFPDQAAFYQVPAAQPQFVGQAQYVEPPISGVQRAVRIRAVKSPSSGGSSRRRQDGFRPQGSHRNKPIAAAADRSKGFEIARSEEDVRRFGFDPQYQWLRGQLRFSPSTGAWHLRYIPSQGGADQYGGQVLIANPQMLGGVQPGEYVQVRGQLQSQPSGVIYAVSIVQRQRVE